jgi:hypothetical protein|nr:MAG TPA: hypothetical protein [Caudoviricetes sp.]
MIFCYTHRKEPWIEIRTYIGPTMNVAFHNTDYSKFMELFYHKTEYDKETRQYISRIIEFIYSVYDKHIFLQQYRNMNREKPYITIDILKDMEYDKIHKKVKSLIKTDDAILIFTADVSPLLSARLYKNMNNKILIELAAKNASANIFRWDRQKVYDLIRKALNLTVPVTSSVVTTLNGIYDICSKEAKKANSLDMPDNIVHCAIRSHGKVEWKVCNNADISLQPFGKDYIIFGYINGSHMYSDTIPGYLLANKHIDANYHIYTRVIMALDYIYDQQHMTIGKNNRSVNEIAMDFGVYKE